jgi:nucleoside-diphosphate-sugar epimerase
MREILIKAKGNIFQGFFIPPKKILITGSSGTIGTRLCELLIKQGYTVIGTDIRPNSWNQKINELTIIADLCKSEDLTQLPTDIDLVVHLAANARVYSLVVNPKLARDNFEMLFNILEFCRAHSIKNFLFSSSREVYGNSNLATHSETEADISCCESPYTATKIGGEALIHAYHRCYGINFIITRFSNVYGMYDDSDRVIPLFIRLTENNQDLIVYGKDKLLDFTYIDDTVGGVIKCIEKFPEVKNNVFNIASGRSVSITDVANLIRKSMNGNNPVVLRENRTGEVTRSVIDITKAKKHLEYKPEISIEQGIAQTITWYQGVNSRLPVV